MRKLLFENNNPKNVKMLPYYPRKNSKFTFANVDEFEMIKENFSKLYEGYTLKKQSINELHYSWVLLSNGRMLFIMDMESVKKENGLVEYTLYIPADEKEIKIVTECKENEINFIEVSECYSSY